MAQITTGDFARAVAPQMPKWFGGGYQRFPELFREFMEVTTMDTAVDEDVLYSTTGLMVQTSEGESTPYDRMKQVYVVRYMPASFKLGLILSAELIEDAKGLDIMEKKAKALGVAYNETLNIVAHNILNRSQNSSYVGGDGVSLLNAAHPTSSGITFSNMPSVAVDLSEAALEQGYIDLGTFIDDRGLKIRAYPRKLIIPRALTFEAQRILGSELRQGTADNDLNAMKNLNVFPDGILVTDYITSPTDWFIKTSVEEDGLKFKFRKELELTDDTHFDTDAVKFKGYTRFATGWSDPRCIYGVNGP